MMSSIRLTSGHPAQMLLLPPLPAEQQCPPPAPHSEFVRFTQNSEAEQRHNVPALKMLCERGWREGGGEEHWGGKQLVWGHSRECWEGVSHHHGNAPNPPPQQETGGGLRAAGQTCRPSSCLLLWPPTRGQRSALTHQTLQVKTVHLSLQSLCTSFYIRHQFCCCLTETRRTTTNDSL